MSKENNINIIRSILSEYANEIYNVTLLNFQLKDVIESNLRDEIKIKILKINSYLNLLLNISEDLETQNVLKFKCDSKD